MTGHHHEPFDRDRGDASSDAKRDHEARTHAHMWIAVGVTMTAIVGFWLVLLPSQFGGDGFFGSEAQRLQEIRDSDVGAPWQASMQSIRADLDAMSAALQAEAAAEEAAAGLAPQTSDDAAYAEGVQRLQERLNDVETAGAPESAGN